MSDYEKLVISILYCLLYNLMNGICPGWDGALIRAFKG